MKVSNANIQFYGLLIIAGLMPFIYLQNIYADENTPVNNENAETVDNGFGSFDDFDDDLSPVDEEQKTEHVFHYGIYFTNLISTSLEQQEGSILRKNELSGYFEYQYGTKELFFYTKTFLSIQPGLFSDSLNEYYRYTNSPEFRRDLSFSSENIDLRFREFYGYFQNGRYIFKVGNQIINWGTADVFKPTSYFNPFDIREFLFKDQNNELTTGIPALTMSAAIGEDTIDVVFVPLHIPARMMVNNSFWGINYSEGPFPVIIGEAEALNFSLLNSALGIKYYKNIFGIDIQTSLYHGPDRDPSLLPQRTVSEPGERVKIEVSPYYETYDAAGLALSTTYKKFIIQGECVYSFNKAGVIDKKINAQTATQSELNTLLPFEAITSQFISYTAGFNYFVPIKEYFPSHNTEAIFTMEWTQSIYFNEDIMTPVFSDILVMRFQDKFLNNKLETVLSAIVDTNNKSVIIMPELVYKATPQITIKTTYSYIQTEPNNYFSQYGRNDFIQWRVTYEN